MSITITRIPSGFRLSGPYSTVYAYFTELDGESAVAFHEAGDPAYSFITTENPADLAAVAYHALRHEVRWQPSPKWP